jgi:hypothetical protein
MTAMPTLFGSLTPVPLNGRLRLCRGFRPGFPRSLVHGNVDFPMRLSTDGTRSPPRVSANGRSRSLRCFETWNVSILLPSRIPISRWLISRWLNLVQLLSNLTADGISAPDLTAQILLLCATPEAKLCASPPDPTTYGISE